MRERAVPICVCKVGFETALKERERDLIWRHVDTEQAVFLFKRRKRERDSLKERERGGRGGR